MIDSDPPSSPNRNFTIQFIHIDSENKNPKKRRVRKRRKVIKTKTFMEGKYMSMLFFCKFNN
jgi:hypothetical protein